MLLDGEGSLYLETNKMSANIFELDKGKLSGTETWHGLPQYELVGDRPVTIEEAAPVVDFPIEKRPTFLAEGTKTGAYAIVRTDTPEPTVLAPAVGSRYVATPHLHIFNQMTENLLASFPELKICGTGTLNNGAAWWIQFLAASYYVPGDTSKQELRLCYSQEYGKSAHKVFCTTVRIVCNNTLRAAQASSAAAGMIRRFAHTRSAKTKINANLDAMAELHLGLQRHQELMAELTSHQVTGKQVEEFLSRFIPEPESDATVSESRHDTAVAAFNTIFVSGQHMDPKVARSRYAVLQAFTDYVDHNSYSRSDAERWVDSLDGARATLKEQARDYLLELA